jgi:hypothetical protein
MTPSKTGPVTVEKIIDVAVCRHGVEQRLCLAYLR